MYQDENEWEKRRINVQKFFQQRNRTADNTVESEEEAGDKSRNNPFDHEKAFALKSLDQLRLEAEKEASAFKKEIRQANLRCAAMGNDLIYQKQILHKVKGELLEEREEEFKTLLGVFAELHELQAEYDASMDKTLGQIDACLVQIDTLIVGLDEVQAKNREFLVAEQAFAEDKARMDAFLR